MAGTEAKKTAPATNSRAQKGAARLTGRRSFHARAHSPCRRISPASPGVLAGHPRRSLAAFLFDQARLSSDDKRQSSHRLSLTCHPHKFLVNLTLKGRFRQGTLGCLKRNFCARPSAPRSLAATAAPHSKSRKSLLRACFTGVLLEIGRRRADRGGVPPNARSHRDL
jgi:hypothetical protein